MNADSFEYLLMAHHAQLQDVAENKPEGDMTHKCPVSVIIDLVNLAHPLRLLGCSAKWDFLETLKEVALTTSIGNEKRFDMIQILREVCEEFDMRRLGHDDTTTRMEAPTTCQEWSDFFNLRLFAPTPIGLLTTVMACSGQYFSVCRF